MGETMPRRKASTHGKNEIMYIKNVTNVHCIGIWSNKKC